MLIINEIIKQKTETIQKINVNLDAIYVSF
jgi:hypothetical protein